MPTKVTLKKATPNIILKGSLAILYQSAINSPQFKKAGEVFLQGLLAIDSNPNLYRERKDDNIVIGLKSDIGKYHEVEPS